MAFPVADLIQTFKPEVWEDFTEEWAHSQEKKYKEVIRYTGAGDMGLDILCFHTTTISTARGITSSASGTRANCSRIASMGRARQDHLLLLHRRVSRRLRTITSPRPKASG